MARGHHPALSHSRLAMPIHCGAAGSRRALVALPTSCCTQRPGRCAAHALGRPPWPSPRHLNKPARLAHLAGVLLHLLNLAPRQPCGAARGSRASVTKLPWRRASGPQCAALSALPQLHPPTFGDKALAAPLGHHALNVPLLRELVEAQRSRQPRMLLLDGGAWQGGTESVSGAKGCMEIETCHRAAAGTERTVPTAAACNPAPPPVLPPARRPAAGARPAPAVHASAPRPRWRQSPCGMQRTKE